VSASFLLLLGIFSPGHHVQVSCCGAQSRLAGVLCPGAVLQHRPKQRRGSCSLAVVTCTD